MKFSVHYQTPALFWGWHHGLSWWRKPPVSYHSISSTRRGETTMSSHGNRSCPGNRKTRPVNTELPRTKKVRKLSGNSSWFLSHQKIHFRFMRTSWAQLLVFEEKTRPTPLFSINVVWGSEGGKGAAETAEQKPVSLRLLTWADGGPFGRQICSP